MVQKNKDQAKFSGALYALTEDSYLSSYSYQDKVAHMIR